MTDKYQDLRDGMPELQREAARKGGYNPRAQLIIDLLAERDALNAEKERLREVLDELLEALQAIVDEVSDGRIPYSSDSYLPAHLVEQARAAIAALAAQPAASAELRCRKCGELARVVISSAQVMAHWPDGSARDERDIASDPEGTLIHDPSEPLRAAAPQTQVQTMQPEISRDLLGRIVDQVFDGAIEDTAVIEDIYRVIAACAPTPSGALLDERDVLAAEVEAMRKDADRYRWLRRKVCIVGGKFHILNLDPRYIAPDAAVELDAAIDAELAKVGAA